MKYTSQAKQLTIDDFKSSLEGLSKSNRWVQLGDSLPRAKIEKLYMLGLPEFTDKPIFDPSLFVTIRKRIGEDVFNDMSGSLLERQIQLQEESEKKKDESKPEEEGEDDNQPQEPQEHPDTRHDFGSEFTDNNSRLHKGVLKIDATCCNAEMRYRAKMPDTSASWIGSCYFVKNVMKFLRELCLVLSEIWLFSKYLLSKGALDCKPLIMVKY